LTFQEHREVMTLSKLRVNGHSRAIRSSADTPLLWVLRDELGLTGTKFGCGQALCGACTVHVGERAVRSCVLPVQAAAGQAVRTIEALDQSREGKALQQAWLTHRVAQCGYCQSGFLMAAAALLRKTRTPSDAALSEALDNLCRCGTYPRIRIAVQAAAAALRESAAPTTRKLP
jgi:isoquinoline 1-oxidoreductase subunit alpha